MSVLMTLRRNLEAVVVVDGITINCLFVVFCLGIWEVIPCYPKLNYFMIDA